MLGAVLYDVGLEFVRAHILESVKLLGFFVCLFVFVGVFFFFWGGGGLFLFLVGAETTVTCC